MTDTTPTAEQIAAAQALLRTPAARAITARQDADAAAAALAGLEAATVRSEWRALLDALSVADAELTGLPLIRMHIQAAFRGLEKIEGGLPAIRAFVADLKTTAEGLAHG